MIKFYLSLDLFDIRRLNLCVPNLKENVALWAPVPYSISSYSSSKGGGCEVGKGGGWSDAKAAAAVLGTDLFSACDLAELIC